MSAIQHEPVTPPRKRAASGAYLRPYQQSPALQDHSELQTTPDANKVPELIWDDVSEAGESFVKTPSDERDSLETTSKGKDVFLTPVRPIKQLRRSNRIKAREASKSLERAPNEKRNIDLERELKRPDCLFPSFLYPDLPTIEDRDTTGCNFMNTDGHPKNFKFSDLLKAARQNDTRSTESPERKVLYRYTKQRGSILKRVKQDRSSVEPSVDYNLNAQPVQCIQTKTLEKSGLAQDVVDPSSGLGTGATRQTSGTRRDVCIQRFTRILPFNALERLTNEPNRCVATLVSRPDQRCSKLTRSAEDDKVRVQNFLSEAKLGTDIFTADSYLRGLINLSTCTAFRHRSIALKQLDLLLSRVGESRHPVVQVKQSKNAFTNKDLEVLPSWLKAWTKFSDGSKNSSVHPLSPTDTSSKDFPLPQLDVPDPGSAHVPAGKVQGTEIREETDMESASGSERKVQKTEVCKSTAQAGSIVPETGAIIVSQAVEKTESVPAMDDSVQACEAIAAVLTVQVHDIPPVGQTIKVEETCQSEKVSRTDECPKLRELQKDEESYPRKTAQGKEVENAQAEGTDQRKAVQLNEMAAIAITAARPVRKSEIKQEADVNPSLAASQERTKMIVPAHTPPSEWAFDPTQTVKISFLTVPILTRTRASEKYGRQYLATSEQGDLRGLYQRFEPNRAKESLQFSSVEGYIRMCLERTLTKREVAMEKNKETGLEKHKGILYMYWITGSFGFVKIGKTSGPSTAKRLDKWRKKCGYAIEEHTKGEEDVVVQLPHVYRVESLVHAELNEFRVKEVACPQCSEQESQEKGVERFVNHTEWFRVSPAHGQKVIDKWSKWMLTNPYEKRNGKWLLKPTITCSEIDELCRPIEVSNDVSVSPSTIRRRSQPGSSASKEKWKRNSKTRRRSPR